MTIQTLVFTSQNNVQDYCCKVHLFLYVLHSFNKGVNLLIYSLSQIHYVYNELQLDEIKEEQEH